MINSIAISTFVYFCIYTIELILDYKKAISQVPVIVGCIWLFLLLALGYMISKKPQELKDWFVGKR